jgi:SAM-dependent methyltransferase
MTDMPASDVPEAIYQRPEDYDLEHVGDTADVDFFVSEVMRLQPKRVLELACGTGRVTLPLAEAGAKAGFSVVGLELVPEMLQAAREQADGAPPGVRDALTFAEGDMRIWRAETPFDLIVTPCSSVCHLLTLDDQLAAWRTAFDNLAPGGRFIVDVAMPDLSAYADSFRRPPREVVEIDLDTYEERTKTRLLRYKTTRYLAHEQRARIRFLYDKFVGEEPPERSVSDFESHVYYPREMRLLFLHTGFTVEKMYGGYERQEMRHGSRQMIVVGRKPSDAAAS